MQHVLVIVQVADTCKPYRIHGPGIEVLGYRDTQKGEEGGGGLWLLIECSLIVSGSLWSSGNRNGM